LAAIDTGQAREGKGKRSSGAEAQEEGGEGEEEAHPPEPIKTR